MSDFYLTDIGQTTLDSLLLGATITLTKIVVTNAYSDRANVETISDLSGTIVFQQSTTGIVESGAVHIEASDTTENEYTAKTIALIFNNGSTEYVFALASDDITPQYVKSEASAQIIIDSTFSNASSISFLNTNILFPTATESRKGSVRIASDAEISAKSGDGVITASRLSQITGDIHAYAKALVMPSTSTPFVSVEYEARGIQIKMLNSSSTYNIDFSISLTDSNNFVFNTQRAVFYQFQLQNSTYGTYVPATSAQYCGKCITPANETSDIIVSRDLGMQGFTPGYGVMIDVWAVLKTP